MHDEMHDSWVSIISKNHVHIFDKSYKGKLVYELNLQKGPLCVRLSNIFMLLLQILL